jgi:hypothetical protein
MTTAPTARTERNPQIEAAIIDTAIAQRNLCACGGRRTLKSECDEDGYRARIVCVRCKKSEEL